LTCLREGREGEEGGEEERYKNEGRMGLIPAVDFGGVHGILCRGSVFGAFKSDETEAARAGGVFSEGRGRYEMGRLAVHNK
jgi:hypothetical protein